MVLHGASLTARDMPAAGPVGTGSGATCTGDGAGRPAARAPVRTPAGTGSQPRRRASPVGTCHRLAAPRESEAPGEPGAGRAGRREKSAEPIRIAWSTLRNAANHGFRCVSALVAPASDRLSRYPAMRRRHPAMRRRHPAMRSRYPAMRRRRLAEVRPHPASCQVPSRAPARRACSRRCRGTNPRPRVGRRRSSCRPCLLRVSAGPGRGPAQR
jgi:hypothetical protein